MGALAGAKPVGAYAKAGFKQRPQFLMHCLLNETVKDSGYAQHPCPPSRFGDFYFPYRLRIIRPVQQFFFNARPVCLQVSFQLAGRHVVHACRSFIGYHPVVGLLHVGAADYFFHQPGLRFRPGGLSRYRDA